jgi:hypothetical protein
MSPEGLASQEPPESLIGTVRIPLLLVALGALFLVEDNWGLSAGRTWPILLVLWGALLIAARRGGTS